MSSRMAVIPRESIQVTSRLAIPLEEVELRYSRSSGPGGQHAQKTETRVEAVFDVARSATLSEAQKTRLTARAGPVVRSQSRNRELALERLGEAIRAGVRVPRKRRPTKPTAASRERRLEGKKRRASVKRMRQRPDD